MSENARGLGDQQPGSVGLPREHSAARNRVTPAEVTRYDSTSDIVKPVNLIRQMGADFFRGKDLAWRLFVRNIRGMYRQTLLGLFWAFVPPIANTAIWIFLRNAGVLDIGDTVVDGTIYILTGMILWQGFVDGFKMPLDLINKNRSMLSKLNFPRESLLLVGLGEVFFDMATRMLLLIPAFLLFSVPFHLTIWPALPVIVALILLGVGLGLLLMPVDALYQDVGRFVQIILPFWMIITPIIYVPRTEYPGNLLNWLNPASPLLLVARDWLLLGRTEHFWLGLLFLLLVVPLLIVGLLVFRISLPVLVERMNVS